MKKQSYQDKAIIEKNKQDEKSSKASGCCDPTCCSDSVNKKDLSRKE